MGEMIESIRGDTASPLKAEAYVVGALRRVYDGVQSVLVDDSHVATVGLAMAGICGAHKLEVRYMAFVRFDIVD